jgi:anti-anti-sigma regulatory factor
LLAFGKFGTYKKAEVLLEALPILRQRYPHKQFRITIAGTDNPNVKGYIDRLQTQYRHDPDVVFTGYVPEEEVAALFQSATLIVFPYTATTGSSGILHQAGSYARACVLPNMDDLARVVEEEGYAGEYFETANPASLAAAIGRLLENPDKRQAIEEANYRAAAALSMDDLVNWYLAHLQSLQTKAPGLEVSFMGKSIPEQFTPIRQSHAAGNRALTIGYAQWSDAKGQQTWHVLRISGAFSAGSIPDFKALFDDLKTPVSGGLYLDMHEVERIDLLGLNELIRLHRYLESQHRKLRILCAEKSDLYQWLQDSGLTCFLRIARTDHHDAAEIPNEKHTQGKQEERIQAGTEYVKNIIPNEAGSR